MRLVHAGKLGDDSQVDDYRVLKNWSTIYLTNITQLNYAREICGNVVKHDALFHLKETNYKSVMIL